MRAIALAFAAFCAVGCGPDDNPCISETSWEGGDDGSDLMKPGQDCVACHDQVDAPAYDVAGTVYHEVDEPDDCNGADGVTIRIIDSDSRVIELTSNEAGNFFHEADGSTLVFPITATVVTRTGERPMASAQDTGSCNDCHTASGNRGAPGRIMIP